MAEAKRGLSIEVDIDVSEALKGLKAVQREAKEATRTLRELQEVQNNGFAAQYKLPVIELGEMVPCEKIYNSLSEYTTAELHEELARRTAVEEIKIGPLQFVKCIIDEYGKNGDAVYREITGPARILINKD